jgi:hypothetical protein
MKTVELLPCAVGPGHPAGHGRGHVLGYGGLRAQPAWLVQAATES